MIKLIEHYLRIRSFQRKQWGPNLECTDEEFIVHLGISVYGIKSNLIPSLPRETYFFSEKIQVLCEREPYFN